MNEVSQNSLKVKTRSVQLADLSKQLGALVGKFKIVNGVSGEHRMVKIGPIIEEN